MRLSFHPSSETLEFQPWVLSFPDPVMILFWLLEETAPNFLSIHIQFRSRALDSRATGGTPSIVWIKGSPCSLHI